jgi:hypothetical protein
MIVGIIAAVEARATGSAKSIRRAAIDVGLATPARRRVMMFAQARLRAIAT